MESPIRVWSKLSCAVFAGLLCLVAPQAARAQMMLPVTQGVSPLITNFDPNAITASANGFNATAGALPTSLQITRFRVNTSVTGSGFLMAPLTIVTQFGQGGKGGQLGQGGDNGFGGGGGYSSYGQGASGVAGGIAAGVGLANTANLNRQPPGVQINSVYGGLTGLPLGQNNFLSSNQARATNTNTGGLPLQVPLNGQQKAPGNFVFAGNGDYGL